MSFSKILAPRNSNDDEVECEGRRTLKQIKEEGEKQEEEGRNRATLSSEVERLYEAHKKGKRRDGIHKERREGRGNPVARSVRGGFVREPIDDAAGS